MKRTDAVRLLFHGIRIFLTKRDTPFFATLILTDQCILSCQHCCLHNYRCEDKEIYSFEQVCADMREMYQDGVRILCLSGGEIALWETNEHSIRELVDAAREIGFLYVALATNGTIPIDYGNADFVLVSIDGAREVHDLIRGKTYDRILENIRKRENDKIVIFMDINHINQREIANVCQLAKDEPNIRAVSFNFHTPFSGTEELALSFEEKKRCIQEIRELMKEGYPVLNLRSCFHYLLNNDFPKPCRQLMVMDFSKRLLCNRCIEEEGLCAKCGYFETAEIAMMFRGKINVIMDAFLTYRKYL